jgi:hypothetical protein
MAAGPCAARSIAPTLPLMRVASTLVWVLPALLGCNSLTGASDLEKVDCFDCADSAVTEDTGIDSSAPPDTALHDTAADTDQTDTFDAAPKPCTRDDECVDTDDCTADFCSGLLTCKNTVVDKDGDGESPSALGACGRDCNDNNKDVLSTQMEFFTTGYTDSTGGLSFDYNCDGNTEPQYTGAYKCALIGSTCTLQNAGWVGTPPGCGRAGKWAANCFKLSFGGCYPAQADRVQGCR